MSNRITNFLPGGIGTWPLSFFQYRDIFGNNFDFRALNVYKTSTMASKLFFCIVKPTIMHMHFSNEIMVKWQNFGYI